MDTIKLYLRSMKMLMRCQMEYPCSFLLNTLSQIIMQGGELFAVMLLIDRFHQIGQWQGKHILFFFGMMTITFYLVECFGRGIASFSPIVQSGALDTMLLRPRGVLTQVCCYAVDPRRLGCILIGIAALLTGANASEIVWTVPKALLLLESIAGGFLLITALFMIEAVTSMHSIKSIEMVNVFTYGGRSTCQYPIDIYPTPMKVLFTVVAPFALTLHVPAAYILDMQILHLPSRAAFLTPLSGLVSFLIMYTVFQKSLKHYRSTGS